MNRSIPLTIPMYDAVYGNTFPEEQYYVVLFDSLPSKFETNKVYDDKLIRYLQKNGFRGHLRIQRDKDRHSPQVEHNLLVDLERRIIFSTRTRTQKGDNLISFDIFYDVRKGDLNQQLDMDKILGFKSESKLTNIHLVKSEMGHLDTEEYPLVVPDCDLELNYGKDFVGLHETMVKRLNTKYDKGIILFHGDPGTGKTTYIKVLTKYIKEKQILFIPPAMAEMLSDPAIITFLMDYKNSILLIEDAEKVIGDRQAKGSAAGVSNILNLTDGILGDCLNIQVIATFNMPRESIDPALLRKGRLISEHKFDRLSIENTNKLLKHLGKNVVSDKGLTLADIYNIDGDVTKITPDRAPVGFQRNK